MGDLSPFFTSVYALRSDPVRTNGIIGARYFTDPIVKKLLPLVEWLERRMR